PYQRLPRADVPQSAIAAKRHYRDKVDAGQFVLDVFTSGNVKLHYPPGAGVLVAGPYRLAFCVKHREQHESLIWRLVLLDVKTEARYRRPDLSIQSRD